MDVEQKQDEVKTDPANWWVAGTLVALVVAGWLYSALFAHRLGHSAGVFVGIPGVLAIVLALTPKAKTVTGGIMKGITLALLIVAPMLGEGWLCILIASPLFYLVGIAVGLAADWEKKRRGTRGATLSCAVLVLVPLSLEGTVPGWTVARTQSVEATRVVAGSSEEVAAAVSAGPSFGVKRPWIIGSFPPPLFANGTGLVVGDTRRVMFGGVEGAPAGMLELRVVESHDGYVRFEAERDESHLEHWLHWDGSEVSWKQIDAGQTRVTWRITYERGLDPAWYFAPMERAAARAAAGYLIATDATPEGRR